MSDDNARLAHGMADEGDETLTEAKEYTPPALTPLYAPELPSVEVESEPVAGGKRIRVRVSGNDDIGAMLFMAREALRLEAKT